MGSETGDSAETECELHGGRRRGQQSYSRKLGFYCGKISFSKKNLQLIVCGLVFLGLPSLLRAHGAPDEKSVTHSQREDLFSSTSKLEELVENELQIVDLLDTFAEYALERAQTIKS